MPPGKEESSPRYPGGWLHTTARLGLYPALFAAFAGLVLSGTIKRSDFKIASATPAIAEPQPKPAPKAVAPEVPQSSLEEARAFLRTATAIAVPIDLKRARPERAVPAMLNNKIDGRSVTVVVAYGDEDHVPSGTSHALMNGPTFLEHYAFAYADFLVNPDRKVMLPLDQVLKLGREITEPTAWAKILSPPLGRR
ncbi:MAG: hypothetical protein EXS38_10095 [Opitutus sp.]|nr:hypothetical protein [Opitutus sp.]